MLRGGSWHYYAYSSRSAGRSWNSPEYRDNVVGFRCASSVPPSAVTAVSTPQPTPTPTSDIGNLLSDTPTPLPLQGLAGVWQGSCYGRETFSIEWKNEGYVVLSCKIDTGEGSTFPISNQSWKNGKLSWTCPHMVPYNGPPFYTNTNRLHYYFFKVQSVDADTLQLSLTVSVDYPETKNLYASTCSVQRSMP